MVDGLSAGALSRRQALGTGGAAIVAAGLSRPERLRLAARRGPRVVIVGAGLAGLGVRGQALAVARPEQRGL